MKTLVILYADSRSLHIFDHIFDGKSAFERCLCWADSCKKLSDSEIVVLADKSIETECYSVLNKCNQNAELLVQEKWTIHNLFQVFAECTEKTGAENVIFAWADQPFLNFGITEKILSDHIEFSGEYTFAEGYPAGLCPEVINAGTCRILSQLSESVKKETVTPVVEEKKSVPEVKKQPEVKKEVVVSKYDYLPKAVNNAKLVFVFDDAGQNMNHLEKFMNLPFPITVAVLPKLTYSRAAADRIRKAGKEVILHQPMQALNLNVNPGPGAITPDMSLYEIEMLVKENIAEVGAISGMNNHEGSMITEDENRISVVMQTLSDMGLYFLDSRTTSQTRVPQAAMSLGLSYYERNVFIDNTQNISDMVKEIEKGLNIANQKGLAIMIGHIWSANTLPNLLMELYPVLVKKGYKFTTVSKSGGLITP